MREPLRFCGDKGLRFGIAPVEHTRTVQGPLFRRGDFLVLAVDNRKSPALLLRFLHRCQLELRHELRRKIQPVAKFDLTSNSGVASFQPFLHQRVRQESMASAQARRFQRRLIALRNCQNVHAFFPRQLGKPFGVQIRRPDESEASARPRHML